METQLIEQQICLAKAFSSTLTAHWSEQKKNKHFENIPNTMNK